MQAARPLFVLLVGGAAVVAAADALARAPGFPVPYDFPEYWSAGRVNLRGGNPYHPSDLIREQRRADPGRAEAVMMWNPPPSLAVYMPLGAVPPRWATLLWLGAQLAATFLACDLLARAYGGPRWVGAVVAGTFVGTWWLVCYGQNTGLLLLGLAGFLHFTRRGQFARAGACAALTALKPHLLAGFGVLLLADAGTRGGRRALAAGVAVVVLALGAALAANPAVVAQFAAAVRHPTEGAVPLSEWWLPAPAFWLRKEVGWGRFWVQFVPCAAACTAMLVWRARSGRWDWTRTLPVAVAASVLVTPYGGWLFDLPVLLVPAVWAVSRLGRGRRWRLVGAFVVGQAAVTAAAFAQSGALHGFWWTAPAALALCLLGFCAEAAPPGGAGTPPGGREIDPRGVRLSSA